MFLKEINICIQQGYITFFKSDSKYSTLIIYISNKCSFWTFYSSENSEKITKILSSTTLFNIDNNMILNIIIDNNNNVS